MKSCKVQIRDYCQELLDRADAEASPTLTSLQAVIQDCLAKLQQLSAEKERIQEAVGLQDEAEEEEDVLLFYKENTKIQVM